MNTNRPLSSRERVQNLIYHNVFDQIPKGELCINDDVFSSIAAITRGRFEEKFHFIQTLGHDLVSLSPHYPRDPKRVPSAEEYVWPDLDKWVGQTSLFTFAVIDGPFEWGLRIFGLEKFFTMIKKSPSSLEELISSVERLNMATVLKLEAEGINGIILADDIAYQSGLFVSPEILRSSFIPSLARQVEIISAKNLPVLYHSDGNYLPVIEDILNTGFNGLQCLEKNAGMDIKELQERFGEKICLWGHLEIDDVSQAGNATFLANLVESIHILASQGKFILGTTSGLFAGVDVNLLSTIYDAL